MYRLWTKEDIKEELNIIANIFKYPCNLDIEISNRAKKRLGAFFFRKERGNIVPIKFVFAEVLINGTYREEIVKEVIVHEYLHYLCDTKTNVSNGHNKLFKEMCRRVGINDRATLKQETEVITRKSSSKRYEIICSKCGAVLGCHKRIDAAERKVRYYKSACCKAKLRYKLIL